MQPSPPVDRDIQGTLTQVEVRAGGWHRFHIMEAGMQYPTKADTKKPELVAQIMSLMGQQIAASIRETPSQNINPNTGLPYTNRHINAIAPAGYTPGVMPVQGAPTPQQYQQQQTQVQPQGQAGYYPPQQAQPQQPQQPQQTYTQQVYGAPPPQQPQTPPQPQIQPGLQGMEREIAIQRQTASKVAAQMLNILPLEQQNVKGIIALCEVFMAYYTYGPLRFGVTAYTSVEGQPPLDGNPTDMDPDAVYARTGVCPDCGFTDGMHAEGCPRGAPVETST